jgi:hypothetical protein
MPRVSFAAPSDSLGLGAGNALRKAARSPAAGPVLPVSPARRPTDFEELQFLASLRQGDERAKRALIRWFHGSLIGFAASILGSRMQAADVVQGAWLAAAFAGSDRAAPAS